MFVVILILSEAPLVQVINRLIVKHYQFFHLL